MRNATTPPLFISGSEKQARQGERPTLLPLINPWRCEQYKERAERCKGAQSSLPQHSPKKFCKKIFGEEEAPPQKSRQARTTLRRAQCKRIRNIFFRSVFRGVSTARAAFCPAGQPFDSARPAPPALRGRDHRKSRRPWHIRESFPPPRPRPRVRGRRVLRPSFTLRHAPRGEPYLQQLLHSMLTQRLMAQHWMHDEQKFPPIWSS